jgi:DNA-binding MarR family transcriptional regulator
VHATSSIEGVTPEALAEDLLALMTYVQRASGNGFYALVHELDLSFTQVKALHVLDHPDDVASVKEVADLLGLSFPAASRTVESLLQRGYLERREDANDRRVKRVSLTPAGNDLVLKLNRERVTGLREFAASLSERERRRLSGALASLLEREEIAICRAPRPMTSTKT